MITSPEKKAAKAKPMVSAMDFACLYSNILCIFGGIFLWGVYLGVYFYGVYIWGFCIFWGNTAALGTLRGF